MLASVLGTHSLHAELLLDDVLDRVRGAGVVEVDGEAVDVGAAAAILEAWDRRFDIDSVGAVVWRELLASFTLDGKKEWQRNVQKDHGRFAFLWTFSTSPVLHDGRLYLQVLQRNSAFQAHGEQKGEPDGKNESYLLAIDPATGKDLWRVVRPAEAVDESLEAFTTPVPATAGKAKAGAGLLISTERTRLGSRSMFSANTATSPTSSSSGSTARRIRFNACSRPNGGGCPPCRAP